MAATRRRSESRRYDERAPLLSRSSDDARYDTGATSHITLHDDEEDDDDEEQTPLPKMQLFILCVMRLSEPICFTVIFPFVNEQVKAALPNVPKSEIGYYAGLIESCFALTQFCTVFLWGRLSDSIGRKPILLIGMAGTFLSTNAFGFAQSLPTMIAARCIAGLFNANVSVLKSVLGEITDETNSARAFSFLPLMFAVGTIVGPFLGGTLSTPAEQFPDLFGGSQFWEKYPFYLPCAVSSLYVLFAFTIGSTFLNETLESKVRKIEASKIRNDVEHHHRNTGQDSVAAEDNDDERSELLATRQAQSLEQSTDQQDMKPPGIRRLLTPEIIKILSSQMLLNLQNISFTSLLPLFCYESVTDGGVSFTRADIGHIMAFNGVLAIIVQSVIFPQVEKRLKGPLPVYRLGLVLYIPSFLMFPIAHLAALWFPSTRMPTWAAFAVGIIFKASAGMSIVCGTLLVNNSSPTKSSLGSLNGLSQSFGSLSRAIGPVLSTSLFAFSSTHKGFGSLVWIVMIAISSTAWLMSFRISVNRKATWREQGANQ